MTPSRERNNAQKEQIYETKREKEIQEQRN
jgi:hypothetical protein